MVTVSVICALTFVPNHMSEASLCTLPIHVAHFYEIQRKVLHSKCSVRIELIGPFHFRVEGISKGPPKRPRFYSNCSLEQLVQPLKILFHDHTLNSTDSNNLWQGTFSGEVRQKVQSELRPAHPNNRKSNGEKFKTAQKSK